MAKPVTLSSLQPALLPLATSELQAVLEHGARKYPHHDADRKTDKRTVDRHLTAADRHLARYGRGEKTDADSKCHALAHVACRILFALEIELGGKK